MKRFLILTLMLALSLAACTGGGTFSGVDTSRINATPAGQAQEPGNTSTPGQTESMTNQTKPPSGSDDTKLVGTWCYTQTDQSTVFFHEYTFFADGTFACFRKSVWIELIPQAIGQGLFVGKWSGSDTKIHITDFYYYVTDTEKEKRSDRTLEYKIYTGNNGKAFLSIHWVGFSGDEQKNYYTLPPDSEWQFEKTDESYIARQ